MVRAFRLAREGLNVALVEEIGDGEIVADIVVDLQAPNKSANP
jgi:hypothetical protein